MKKSDTKHIFIINPVAGTGKAHSLFMPKILSELKKYSIDYKFHITTGVLDAKRFVKRLCYFRKDENQTLRFYACGGDGTLSEVVNGANNCKNIEIACIPAGSGNDFIRNFKNADFKNIEKQINANSQKIDLMKCTLDDKYSVEGVNIVNMGLDCQVVKYMEKVKKTKIINGSMAYIYGALKAFFKIESYDVSVKADDKKIFDGAMTLLAIGNGTTYGGGFRAAPRAVTNDGLLDICIVKKINRRQFLELIGDYRNGNHIDNPNTKDIIKYEKAKKFEIQSRNGLDISFDGELVKIYKAIVEVIPRAINFVVPEE